MSDCEHLRLFSVSSRNDGDSHDDNSDSSDGTIRSIEEAIRIACSTPGIRTVYLVLLEHVFTGVFGNQTRRCHGY